MNGETLFRNPALWIALGGYIIAGIWAFATLSGDVNNVKASVAAVTNVVPRLNVVETLQAAQYAGTVETMRALTSRLDRIDTKIDALLAR